MTSDDSINDLVSTVKLLVTADDFDGTILLISCKQSEVLKNIEDYFRGHH